MTAFQELADLLWPATLETLRMVGLATLFTVLAGVPLGVLLRVGPAPVRHALGLVVNIGRSLPFIILMIAVIPFTRLVVGTSIGTEAAVVPLTVGAIPFFARLVEGALADVDPGLTEAGHAFGATRTQIVAKILLPEALPALIRGLTVTVVALVGYSAMAGVIGGGGLGYLAIRYGYQRFETDVMLATVAVLIALVQIVQFAGDRVARRLDRR
ncbi:MAG: ABC transporter permease [Hamadaea sp.]|nr:ABC transporter permease [Hamadaea sp.]